LEDCCITDSKLPAAEDLGFILNQIVLKMNKIVDIDYFLTDKLAFSEDVKNKNVEKFLEEIGLVKSGYVGYKMEC